MELLTVAQAAERLGVKPQLVYALCSGRKLRHCKIGNGRGVLRIPLDAIEEYLRNTTIPVCDQKNQPQVRRVKLRHFKF